MAGGERGSRGSCCMGVVGKGDEKVEQRGYFLSWGSGGGAAAGVEGSKKGVLLLSKSRA